MNKLVREFRWDSNSADFVEAGAIPGIKTSKANWWDKAYYGPSLEIASRARNALLAVVAIIRNRNKGGPFVFGNVTMKELGFRREDKIKALKELEATGFVKVEWRGAEISSGHSSEEFLTKKLSHAKCMYNIVYRHCTRFCTDLYAILYNVLSLFSSYISRR